MNRQNNPNTDNRHLIGGIVVLIIGILFLLRNFEILNDEIEFYIFSWKTLLIGIGILNISLTQRKVGGFILIAVGTFFWLPELFDVSIRTSQLFWPVVLVIVGLMMLFKKTGYHNNRPWNESRFHTNSNPNSESSKNTSNEDYVNDVAIFSGITKVINSNHFKGGKMTAIFGGSELNLSHARLAPGTHVIDVLFMFGGSEIIVPADWHIIIETTPIFGGVTDKRNLSQQIHNDEPSDSVLIIRGSVIFGGAEIKSY